MDSVIFTAATIVTKSNTIFYKNDKNFMLSFLDERMKLFISSILFNIYITEILL